MIFKKNITENREEAGDTSEIENEEQQKAPEQICADERERLKSEIISEVTAALGGSGDISRERLEFDAQRRLAEKGLPEEFAPMLTGKTAEETCKSIAAFERLFAEKTAEAVKEKIKGSVPKIGSITDEKDSFLKGLE